MYIKKFEMFKESLKPSQFRKYVKKFDKERYDDIFKKVGDDYDHDRNYYRVYIPVKREVINGFISDTHELIDEFLNENGYEIVDYVKGTAKSKNEKEKTFKINKDIESSKVNLVGNNFDEISSVIGREITKGVIERDVAIDIANKMGLDLVEVSGSKMSVCMITDYKDYLSKQTIKTVKIGQLLNQLKNDKLINLFTSDEYRKSMVSTGNDDLLVVISRHPYDIAGSDTDRNWTNCMTIGTDKSNRLTKLMTELEDAKRELKNSNDDLKSTSKLDEIKDKIKSYKKDGMNVKYLIHEVEQGSLISYLVKSSDKNIENPLGVLNIKPYESRNEIMLLSSSSMYGISIPEFKKTVDMTLNKYFNKDIKDNLFKINKKVYNDEGDDYHYTNFETASIYDIYGLINYVINEDGTIDVEGSVNLSNKKLTKLPLKFGKVTGSFHCQDNKLTSLRGCPTEVGGDFSCYNNRLTSLKGCPTEVGGDFSCYNNRLTSLKGCPKEVDGNFHCHKNKIKTLEGSPNEVGGSFYCDHNEIISLKYCPKEVGRYFSCIYNPVNIIYKLFPNYKQFIKSLNFNYFLGGNKIDKSKLEQALKIENRKCPDAIEGYVWE